MATVARRAGALILSLFLAACSLVPGPSERNADIAYGPDARQTLDVYAPAKSAGADGAGRKVVVFFYGGSWRNGDKKIYRSLGHGLRKRGFVTVVANYRLYPQVAFPAFVDDAALAVAWVHRNAGRFGGDPAQIYLMGHSAGAHIAMLAGLDPRYLKKAGVPRSAIKGIIGLAGPYAFNPLGGDSWRPVFEKHGDPEEARPVTYARHTGPRLLLLHGDADKTVRPEMSRKMAAAYRAAGGDVTLKFYPGMGHIRIIAALFGPLRLVDPVVADITGFLGKPTP